MDPKFEENVILTKTERLMLSSRPPDPKNARNKNVLIVGGSGSGKTRFWIKPNLLQMHSSYVLTDPKGLLCLGQKNPHKNIINVQVCRRWRNDLTSNENHRIVREAVPRR